MELVITTAASPERYVIGIEGEVDISNASKVRDAIDLALEQPTEEVQLDLARGVHRLDGHRRARGRGAPC